VVFFILLGQDYLSLTMRLIILLTLILSQVNAVAQSVTVMSYNIRLDTENDGVNQWKNRTEKVYSLIRKYNPDLVGVQEALHNQMMDLKTNLPEYDFVGVGRDDGKEKGEYSAIFYKKDMYDIIDQNTFWLSETPEVPGSKSWDAAITRVASWAMMKEKATGKTFVIVNTHFDHIGKAARANSALMIKKFVSQYKNSPVIITGDFNSQPEELPYQNMIAKSGNRIFDSRPVNSKAGTFCNFKVNSMECKTIDYIFHSSHWQTKKYLVIEDNDGAYYPSDHLPVTATLTLKK
jgi:endonuclease/exonuclease/phosphatase family metal-dependent hydrolase